MDDLPHPQTPSPQAERGNEEQSGQSWTVAPALWAKLKPLARQKRQEPTIPEDKLWQQLRGRKLAGMKFRRQHAIERFILDFYCAEAKLGIEVDGAVHEYTQVEDAIRQEFLENFGLHIIRFTNEQVLNSMDGVLHEISKYLPDK
jgi:very-short-patch-repair endonuclease